ncbi:MAG: NINE protein [Novosphingobium sp.]
MQTDSRIANMKYCVGCATPLHSSAQTCPKCGARQGSGGGGEKSRVAAIILALFLGGFGVHKFYLGRIAAGVLYLLFFWTFIPAIIAFVEMIVYITMSDEAFAEKYG